MYQSKLTDLGIPINDLGFEELESKASKIPSGIVATRWVDNK